MSRRERIAVLGTSGSIGFSTLDVIRENPESFELFAVTAHNNVRALTDIVREFRPRIAVLSGADDRAVAADLFPELQRVCAETDTEILRGANALEQVASMPEVDVVVAGIVGAAGLASVFTAARHGKRILLANKEALVMSGAVLMDMVLKHGATLLPIDSEHNAIFQCLPDQLQQAVACKSAARAAPGAGEQIATIWNGISRIHLTASGGPFRGQGRASLAQVTPAQACKHPNWQMGQKISIDSATLMNKGLELIEACWLFDLTPAQINVVIHPESIIHSMVEFIDGSVLAQLGAPDMKTPIASALGWPRRIGSRSARLDLFALNGLHFEAPDHEAFPCLGLAGRAFEAGGAAPAVLNAANEIAVQAFIDQRIGFLDISKVIQASLDSCIIHEASTLEAIVEADARSRVCAEELVRRFS
ncbi:MAG: 1-deoxy-D-xylulose-5-phosphate reductoisomerase [unclassified Hahellaceae]|mgnify:CR=1 FL=1|nr:1-deoxy-D-xylulose-5-phosphate reductoisomerase [Hahellaceae bacterium]|tara:strand:+ start:19338 stop:20594 length:1257 start_codon:yes stop_codon:yes gene_type:complete